MEQAFRVQCIRKSTSFSECIPWCPPLFVHKGVLWYQALFPMLSKLDIATLESASRNVCSAYCAHDKFYQKINYLDAELTRSCIYHLSWNFISWKRMSVGARGESLWWKFSYCRWKPDFLLLPTRYLWFPRYQRTSFYFVKYFCSFFQAFTLLTLVFMVPRFATVLVMDNALLLVHLHQCHSYATLHRTALRAPIMVACL